MKLYREAIIGVLLFFAFTPFAPALQAQPNSLRQQDRQAIEDLHQTEIRANIALDVEELANLWTDEVVSLPPDGPPLIGRAANVQFLEATAKKMADYNILSYTQDWQQVFQLAPEYAMEWGYIAGRLQAAAGGEEIEYRYKVLRILKRLPDGSWKVHRTSWNDASDKPRPEAAASNAAGKP